MSAAVVERLAHYREAFEAVPAGHAGIAAQRTAAFERFAALGVPGARDEAWKYTSLRRLESRRFPVRTGSATPATLPTALAGCRIAIVDGVHLDMQDMTGFEYACRMSRDLGFDGKSIFHPDQVAYANDAFSPSPASIERARKIITAWDVSTLSLPISIICSQKSTSLRNFL